MTELGYVTKLHHTKMSTKIRKTLGRCRLIEIESISVDRARCGESSDVSFNEKSHDFTTENMIFPVVLCIFAGNDVIRKER